MVEIVGIFTAIIIGILTLIGLGCGLVGMYGCLTMDED